MRVSRSGSDSFTDIFYLLIWQFGNLATKTARRLFCSELVRGSVLQDTTNTCRLRPRHQQQPRFEESGHAVALPSQQFKTAAAKVGGAPRPLTIPLTSRFRHDLLIPTGVCRRGHLQNGPHLRQSAPIPERRARGGWLRRGVRHVSLPSQTSIDIEKTPRTGLPPEPSATYLSTVRT